MKASERNDDRKAVIRELVEVDVQYIKKSDAIIVDDDSSFLPNKDSNNVSF